MIVMLISFPPFRLYFPLISPDGNAAKEVYQISSPRAICYDKNENKILVCHTDRKTF